MATSVLAQQAIERLLEPATWLIPGSRPSTGEPVTKRAAKQSRDAAIVAALVASTDPDQKAATEQAAEWQQVVDQITDRTRIIAWAAATALGFLAAGYFGLFFLSAIGASVDPWVDIAITGVVVGGGSKALHDLIGKIQKSKEKDDRPDEVRI